MNANSSFVKDLILGCDIPKNSIIHTHARIKQIKELTGLEYTEVTRQILQALESFSPRAIIVPTLTMIGFLKSGIYHSNYSKSEEGRFSEEVRTNFATYRTPDPMYSVCEVGSLIKNKEGIDYSKTYGEGTLSRFLLEENAVILNINLGNDIRIMSHDAEFQAGVAYRETRQVLGEVYTDEITHQSVKYECFIRRIDPFGREVPDYNRTNVRACMEKKASFGSHIVEGIEVNWIPASDAFDSIMSELTDDPLYLVKE